MKLTKEKAELLLEWIIIAHDAGCKTEHRDTPCAAMACALAGVVIAELPENHEIFQMASQEALTMLAALIYPLKDKLFEIAKSQT